MPAVSIEKAILEKLTGDAQKNALAFAAFLSAHALSLTPNDGGEGWAVGGSVGNSIGYLLLNGAAQFPGPWTLWLNCCDFEENAADDALKQAAWAHASPCGKCHPGWAECGGGARVIFGKPFERLCHSPVMFHNPDAQELKHLKALMLMLK